MFQVEGVNINISMYVFQHLPVLHEFVASVTRALIDLCAVAREWVRFWLAKWYQSIVYLYWMFVSLTARLQHPYWLSVVSFCHKGKRTPHCRWTFLSAPLDVVLPRNWPALRVDSTEKKQMLALDKLKRKFSCSLKLQENFRFKPRNERFQFNHHSQCKLRSLKLDLLNCICKDGISFPEKWGISGIVCEPCIMHVFYQKEIFKWCNLI